MQLASVSVDLDPLRCYYGIHGLGETPGALRDVILRRALPRFLELFARLGIKATFFVVGEDFETSSPSGSYAGRLLLRAAADAGHELASHSYTHPYELVRMPRARVAEEINRAHELIAEATGTEPVGFRSPGYNLSPSVMELLVERGYRYDSSILPAPLYYAAKAAVMGAMQVVGKKSGSTLGDPRFLLAPLLPYRPEASRPWRRGEAPIVELPITVTPLLRLWVIGTAVLIAPPPVRALLLHGARRHYFNFELHGIDLVGADEDGIPAALVARQPDLRVTLDEKTRVLEGTMRAVLARGGAFVRVSEAAERFEAQWAGA